MKRWHSCIPSIFSSIWIWCLYEFTKIDIQSFRVLTSKRCCYHDQHRWGYITKYKSNQDNRGATNFWCSQGIFLCESSAFNDIMVGYNVLNNTYSISRDKIYITTEAFDMSGYYGSRCWKICIGHNTYTDTRRGTIVNGTPIQVSVPKNDIKFHSKIEYFNVILQILDENYYQYHNQGFFFSKDTWSHYFKTFLKGNMNHVLFVTTMGLCLEQGTKPLGSVTLITKLYEQIPARNDQKLN